RLRAIERGWAAHRSFHVGQPGTARAAADVRALRAGRQIANANRAHVGERRRVAPDVEELLLAHIAGRQWELNAWKDVTVRRHVAGRMAGAARQRVADIFGVLRRRYGARGIDRSDQ